jgi:flagellin
MSSINTNVQSMVAARYYKLQNMSLNQSLTHLSTGLKINKGADDPAGLIASESLRADKAAIGAAQYNITRAKNVVSVAESGLGEINRLMTELESLLDRSANKAGLSDDERAANQAEIDSILSSINRIATATEFNGRKLLSGELDYTTSGVSSTNFGKVGILGARLAEGQSRTVVVQVTASAQLASLTYSGATTGAGTTTLEISGALGTETLSFASGTSIANVKTAINEVKNLTGVSATTSTSTLKITSTGYGSKQFVSVKALAGAFTVTGGDTGADTDKGRDATVLINGTTATTDGLQARLQTSVLNVKLDLKAAFGTTLGTSTFYVTGGGADFMITPTLSLNGLESIGMQAVSTSSLGSDALGFVSTLGSGQTNSLSSGNFSTAQRILREAQVQVAELRGRLGAFQKNTLETMSNALDITLENTAAAESVIRDTDFAVETSNLTRSQILVQAATSTLRLANQSPQSVLALLQ